MQDEGSVRAMGLLGGIVLAAVIVIGIYVHNWLSLEVVANAVSRARTPFPVSTYQVPSYLTPLTFPTFEPLDLSLWHTPTPEPVGDIYVQAP